ncbi:MAG TPA: hypothetical protein VFA60_08945 [Terriglobales bacterium]|nr:hypothetical protein [Terriglobales bacterium]
MADALLLVSATLVAVTVTVVGEVFGAVKVMVLPVPVMVPALAVQVTAGLTPALTEAVKLVVPPGAMVIDVGEIVTVTGDCALKVTPETTPLPPPPPQPAHSDTSAVTSTSNPVRVRDPRLAGPSFVLEGI